MLTKTKLDENFSDAQFMIENYQFSPFRRNRNNKEGGKMVFTRKELLANRLEDFETKSTENNRPLFQINRNLSRNSTETCSFKIKTT